jgi:hypothetical protein
MQSSTGIQQQACANSFENFSLEFDKRSQRAITREMRRGATRTSASTCSTTTSSEERSPARCPQGCPLGALEEPREILTSLQRTTLALIEKTNKPLYRAYLLKEQLRLVFQLPFAKAVKALDRWLSWARRCRLQPFVRLARSVAYYRDDIEAALRHRLSNALVESTNTKIRLITRRSFGFYSPAPLIALAMLSLGGLMPTPARPWIAPTDMAVEPEILSHSVLPDFLGMVLRCSN